MATRVFTLILLSLICQFIGAIPLATESGVVSPQQHLTSIPDVALRAASGATTRFLTQNGRSNGGDLPQAFDIPHLVLYRDGELTDPTMFR